MTGHREGEDRGDVARRPMRDWRPSLLLKFGVLTFIPILLLGLVLGQTMRSMIQERTVANAEESARIGLVLIVENLLTPESLRVGLRPDQRNRFEEVLHSIDSSGSGTALRIWNLDRRVVYDNDHSVIRHAIAPPPGVAVALAGDVSSGVLTVKGPGGGDTRRSGRFLRLFVPLRWGKDGAVAGVAEIRLPNGPFAAVVDRYVRQLYAVLGIGLALLWALLFRIMAGASRTLRRQAKENRHLALHDPLTGLPNRLLFNDRLQQAIVQAGRSGGYTALLVVDLNDFKQVNDRYGHHIGDAVLQHVANQLGKSVRKSDTVGRLGGDEFGVVLHLVASRQAAGDLAQSLLTALQVTLVVEDLRLVTKASIGIALYPEHGEKPDLMQRADIAMYVAKAGDLGTAFYELEIQPA